MNAGGAAPETITLVLDAHGRPLRSPSGGSARQDPQRHLFGTRRVPRGGARGRRVDDLAAVLDAVVTARPRCRHPRRPGQVLPAERQRGFRLLQPQEGLVSARRPAPGSPRDRSASTTSSPMACTATPRPGCRPSRIARVAGRSSTSTAFRCPSTSPTIGSTTPTRRRARARAAARAVPRRHLLVVDLQLGRGARGDRARSLARFKLKLAFWLDRPLIGTEVKRWMAAEGAPVDPAVFGAVQLIYLARPGFGPGLHDPVPRRCGVWHGEESAVAVPVLLPEPPP